MSDINNNVMMGSPGHSGGPVSVSVKLQRIQFITSTAGGLDFCMLFAEKGGSRVMIRTETSIGARLAREIGKSGQPSVELAPPLDIKLTCLQKKAGERLQLWASNYELPKLHNQQVIQRPELRAL